MAACGFSNPKRLETTMRRCVQNLSRTGFEQFSLDVYFNRKCLEMNLTPKYAQIKEKINPHNKFVNKKMIDNFQNTRIRNKMKFWHSKIKHLNKVLYNPHLENGHIWQNSWNIIYQYITTKIKTFVVP
jgi:hypothetical protein